MTENKIKEIYKSLANGDEWECKCNGYNTCSYCEVGFCPDETWRPYKLGEAIHENFEYRKVEKWYVTDDNKIHKDKLWDNIVFKGSREECEQFIMEHTKTWLDETFPLGEVIDGEKERLGIYNVCKKILEEVDSLKWVYEDAWDRGFEVIEASDIHKIIKYLGVEL